MADERAKRAAEKIWDTPPGTHMSVSIREMARIIGAEYADVLAENERLKQQVEELRADAERYRWLRDIGGTADGMQRLTAEYPHHRTPSPSEFDAAIDAARSR